MVFLQFLESPETLRFQLVLLTSWSKDYQSLRHINMPCESVYLRLQSRLGISQVEISSGVCCSGLGRQKKGDWSSMNITGQPPPFPAPLMCTIDVIWRVSGRRKGKGEVTGSHLYRTGINIAHSESDQYTRRIESPGPLAEKHEGGKCGIIPSRCSLCTPCNSSLRSLQNPPLFNCLLLIYWICSVSKTNSNSSDFMLI